MKLSYIKTKKDSYGSEVETLQVGKMILHFVLLIIALSFVFGALGTIDQTERGVHLRFSKVVGTKAPGLYFKIPYIESVRVFKTDTQIVSYERENPLESASKDLQDVNIAVVLNYHLDPTGVQEIYARYKSLNAFSANVIRPAVRDTVKAMASNFTAEELVTKRVEFTESVNKTLVERLGDKFVVVERVNITNFQFSTSFTASIERKVTAEQDALTAKNKLEQVEFEKAQRIAEAEGEAEAIRISAKAINSQGGADYVKLKAIEKWDGLLPVQMIPGGTVPFINLTN